MRTLFASTVLALSLAAAGLAHAQAVKAGALTLSGLQLRATPAGVPTSAAYLTIENRGKSADKLVDIECGCAASAMMHRSETRNGVSSMSMVGEVAIPAGGKVEFRPDGLHVMLVGLKGGLKAGQTEVMTLRFQKAGKVKAPFRVVDVIK
ncbi:MAG TPA: copper chaperone PCu(A)C [Caulobacteraceae bacterium]